MYSEINWSKKILCDKYVPIKELGSGCYSSVWLAYNAITKSYHSLKIHSDDNFCGGLKESEISEKLNEINNDHVVKFVESFTFAECENVYHITVYEPMSYTLYDLMKSNKRKLDFVTTMKLIYQAIKGLNGIHSANYFHGDFKCENCMLDGFDLSTQNLIDEIGIEKFHKRKRTVVAISNHVTEFFKKKYAISYSDADNNSTDDKDDEDSGEDCDTSVSDHSDTSEKSSDTFYSTEFEIIKLRDDDNNENGDDNHSVKSDITENDNTQYGFPQIPEKIIKELVKRKVSVVDLGWTADMSEKRKRKHIQTKYYRSPEIIMDLDYDDKSDMWAVGCSIYEMLYGKLLFNLDEDRGVHSGHHIRHHMKLIVELLGLPPQLMINKSPFKHSMFTVKQDRLKGFKFIVPNGGISEKFKYIPSDIQSEFYSFIEGLLKIDPQERLSSTDALKHDIFRYAPIFEAINN